MSGTRNVSRAAPSTPTAARGQPGLHIADFLLPVSLCLWAAGLKLTNTAALGPYGLLPDLPVIFYAGVTLLVVSVTAELAHGRPSNWRLAMHATALVVMLYGTAPLLYPEGRYTWLYKTIGVVQYVNAHGHLNDAIDIYQNWPGFFALAGWFTKLAGVGSPLAYAKWAQLVFELAALPLLYLIYEALRLTNRQRWAAILLYAAGNWIGQDYFSPQATGTVLSLGVMAMALRWLYVPEAARVPVWRWLRGRRTGPAGGTGPPAPPVRRSGPVIIAILLVFFVLTFTHELSPYIVVMQVGALAAVGALRPRWLAFALAAIAVGYLLPHWTFVSSHFGLLRAIGNFFKNAAPPALKVGASPSERVIERCSEVLSLGIWALAAAGAWLRRRAGQDALPLPLLAYSPVLLLAVQGYGHEGILRVFLFSLPWSAALGACALLPRLKEDRRTDGSRGHARQRAQLRRWNAARRRVRAMRVGVGLGAALVLFFPSFFGDDAMNVMPPSEVVTVTSFLTHAAPGTIYLALNGVPMHDDARYDQFPVKMIFGSHGVLGNAPAGPDVADALASRALKRHGPIAKEPVYVIVAPTMVAYSRAYQMTRISNFGILRASLAHSPSWKLISSDAGTVIYELVAAGHSPGG